MRASLSPPGHPAVPGVATQTLQGSPWKGEESPHAGALIHQAPLAASPCDLHKAERGVTGLRDSAGTHSLAKCCSLIPGSPGLAGAMLQTNRHGRVDLRGHRPSCCPSVWTRLHHLQSVAPRPSRQSRLCLCHGLLVADSTQHSSLLRFHDTPQRVSPLPAPARMQMHIPKGWWEMAPWPL